MNLKCPNLEESGYDFEDRTDTFLNTSELVILWYFFTLRNHLFKVFCNLIHAFALIKNRTTLKVMHKASKIEVNCANES